MDQNKVKEAVSELMDNLGTVGSFMLGETRALLHRTRNASREEFMAALDRSVKNMKESGKWARDDIERAAEQIRGNWRLVNEDAERDREAFMARLSENMKKMGEITEDTFDLAVNQTKEALDRYWTATGRLGDAQLEEMRKRYERMAEEFKKNRETFRESLKKSGDKFERAVRAAWTELTKPDK